MVQHPEWDDNRIFLQIEFIYSCLNINETRNFITNKTSSLHNNGIIKHLITHYLH